MSVFQQRVSLQNKCNLNGEFHSSKPEKRDWKCYDTFEEEKKSLLEALLSNPMICIDIMNPIFS